MDDSKKGISNGNTGEDIRRKLNRHRGAFIKRRPMMTLRFDDAYLDCHTDWFPYLTSKGLTGSTFALASLVGTSELIPYATWDQLHELEDAGWEIGCHANTDVDINTLDEDGVDSEIDGAMAIFNAQGLDVKVYVPAYYGGRSIYGRQRSREYFRGAGTGFSVGVKEGVNPECVDIYNICAVRGDISGDYICTTPEGIAATKGLIDEAVAGDGWIVYYVHGHTNDIQTGLDEIIDYALAAGIEFGTYSDCLDVFDPYLYTGHAFGVSENSVMINKATGEALWIDDDKTLVGRGAGKGNKLLQHTIIGYLAGAESSGYRLTAIGEYAGWTSNGSQCTYVGYRAGMNDNQPNSTFVGVNAGNGNTGSRSVGLGLNSMQNNTGYGAHGIGFSSGLNNTGTRATFFGLDAGNGNTGANALGIGAEACKDNSVAGRFEIKQANASAIPLIFGNFVSQLFGQGVPDAVPDDADLDNNTMSMYLDEAGNTLNVKVKYSNGTVKTAVIANLT